MLSDNQHIDDFFRKKEEAFAPDNFPVATHWQQFKTQLTEPGGDPGKPSPGNTPITRLLGLLVVAAVVMLIAINPFKHRKNKKTATAKQQSTIVVGAPQTTPRQAIQTPDHPLPVKVTATAANKPVPEQSPILISAVPAAPVVPSNGKDTLESAGPDATKLLQSFFQQLEQPATEFSINTDRDTNLVAREGTRLFVPAHTIINKAGPVKIIVREYYKYEDIIAAKLTTTSNGQQLITGGMVHISAEQDGQPVVIAPQKAITVSMPTSNYDDGMQLFAGQEAPRTNPNNITLNWLPVGPLHTTLNDHSGPIGKELNLNTVKPFSVNYGKKTTAKFYVSRSLDIPKSALKARLKQRFGSYYDVIKIKRAPKKVYSIRHKIIDSVPVYDTGKVLPVKTTQQDSIRYDREQKEDAFYYAQQARLANTFSFTLTNFGWFNCDRFMNNPGPKANVTVNLPEGGTAGNHVCLLVFTRNQSVVPGVYRSGQIEYFPSMPAGELAILVTVAVTASHVVCNMHPLTISGTTISNLDFTPTTPEQFKQQLQTYFPTQKKQ